MNAQFPGVPEGLDHLRLLGQIFVLFILYIPLVHKGLEIGAVLDAIGRINIHHLYLSGHALFLQQRIHDYQAVSGNHPIGPVDSMLVKLDRLPAAAHPLSRSFRFKHGLLPHKLPFQGLGILLHNMGNNAVRLDGFVNMDRRCGHLKTGALGFTRPLERGVKMSVKLIGFYFFFCLIMLGHTHWRVVGAFFIIVSIRLYIAHFFSFGQFFRPCHDSSS